MLNVLVNLIVLLFKPNLTKFKKTFFKVFFGIFIIEGIERHINEIVFTTSIYLRKNTVWRLQEKAKAISNAVETKDNR